MSATELRTCKECGKTKPIEDFCKLRRWYTHQCKECYNAIHRLYSKQWHERNPTKRKEYKYRWKNKDPIHFKMTQDEGMKRLVKNMPDCYIRSLIIWGTKLKPSDIPIELVGLKRAELTLKREAKRLFNNG